MNQVSLLGKYCRYLEERFPLTTYCIYTFSLFLISASIGKHLSDLKDINLFNDLFGFSIVLLFFLQLRIMDEFKDIESDLIEHPERKLSKGEITLQELKPLLYVVIALQLGINIYLGFVQFIIWAGMMLWSFCMLKEFFLLSFLKKRPILYLISHQLVIPMLCLYSIRLQGFIVINRLNLILILFFLSACISLTLNIELIKKLKTDPALNGLPLSLLLVIYASVVLIIINFFLGIGAQYSVIGLMLCLLYIYLAVSLKVKFSHDRLAWFKECTSALVFVIFFVTALGYMFHINL